jgi:hypothetical protein
MLIGDREDMNDYMLQLLDIVETQEEFDALIHNLQMLWAAKSIAQAEAAGLGSAANN